MTIWLTIAGHTRASAGGSTKDVFVFAASSDPVSLDPAMASDMARYRELTREHAEVASDLFETDASLAEDDGKRAEDRQERGEDGPNRAEYLQHLATLLHEREHGVLTTGDLHAEVGHLEAELLNCAPVLAESGVP